MSGDPDDYYRFRDVLEKAPNPNGLHLLNRKERRRAAAIQRKAGRPLSLKERIEAGGHVFNG